MLARHGRVAEPGPPRIAPFLHAGGTAEAFVVGKACRRTASAAHRLTAASKGRLDSASDRA